MEIEGKVILITGASEGIGRATALMLSKTGAKLVLSSRNEAKLNEVAEAVGGAVVIPADMTEPDQARRIVRETNIRFGRLDVLINNAGQGMYCPVEAVRLDDLERLMRLNLYGPLAAMQEAIPIMRAQGGGSIVNVSSVVSKSALPGVGGYAATKYALNGITLTARNELQKDGIIVSLVLPGTTDTGFAEHAYSHAAGLGAAIRRGSSRTSTAEDVAAKVLEAVRSGAAELFVQA